jgi:4-hydroxybenzoate polyprenyltransferase
MPLIGNFTIALLAGLSLTVVALYYQSNAYLIMHYAFFAFALSLVREIIKDMEDLKGDQRFGSKTLPIIWGIRRTKNFLYFLIGLFVILFAFMTIQLQNSTLSLFFLLLLPPILYFILLLYRADTQHRFLILSNYCKIFMLVGVFSMIFF